MAALFREEGRAGWRPARVEVHDILANDEQGVARVSVSASREGRAFSDTGAHVLHLRDGRVVRGNLTVGYGWDEMGTAASRLNRRPRPSPAP
jgi:hypothetical protein